MALAKGEKSKANKPKGRLFIYQLKSEGIQSDIDRQLYVRSGLSEEEVTFIEGMI